jgi:acyl carrier protein
VTDPSLREDLMAVIAMWGGNLDGTVAGDTPLLTSARLDSHQLFQLLLWIEERVGHQIDATAIDIAVEWDTVDRIVAFVQREARAT